MFPMSCPNCGKRGTVPLERLNSRLKCKKCGTVFFMDETGAIVLGDPNDPKARGRRKRAEEGPPVEIDLRKMLRDIPRPVRYGAAALAGCLALGLGIAALVKALGVPSDLQGRSAYVAELFVDNEVDRLRRLAKPGTADDLAKWHDLMRPRLNYEGARRSRRDVYAGGEVMNASDSNAWSYATLAVARADSAPPSPAGEEGAAPRNSLSLSLYWDQQGGAWLIDGTKTLQEASKPEPAPLKLPPAARGGVEVPLRSES